MKVVLFGSTTIPSRFHEGSDIDLAVWGLAPEKYFALLSDLDRRSEYFIDLIPAEDARSSIQKKIETGEVLFERKGT
jgi:predicted nucleotidyltransferase